MRGGKPSTNAPDLPQGQSTRGSRAASNGAGSAQAPVAAGNDPGTERADAASLSGAGQPQRHHIRGHDPAGDEPGDAAAGAPAAAHGSRFGMLPAWALLPRDVAIGLAAIVAAGVVILLVLGWQ